MPKSSNTALQVAQHLEVPREISDTWRRFAGLFPFFESGHSSPNQDECQSGAFFADMVMKDPPQYELVEPITGIRNSAAKLFGAQVVSLDISCDTNVSSA